MKQKAQRGTGIITLFLTLFLIAFVFVSVARGTLYGAIANMNVERLYEAFGSSIDNPVRDIVDEIVCCCNGIVPDEVLDFLNDRRVKGSTQRLVNSAFDMLLTGDPGRLMSIRDIEREVKSLKEPINSHLGLTLTDEDIEMVAEHIIWEYFEDFSDMATGYIRDTIQDFWREVPGGGAIRMLLHPVTRYVTAALCLLAAAGIFLLNRNRFAFKSTGRAMIIAGVFALLMLVLYFILVNITAEILDISADSVSVIFTGYRNTAIGFMCGLLALGVIFVVVKKLLDKRNTAV